MRSRVTFVLLVMSVHLAVCLGWPPAAAATVYLPLWPLSAAGVQVVAQGAGGWGAPTGLGWAACALSWLMVYGGGGVLLARHTTG